MPDPRAAGPALATSIALISCLILFSCGGAQGASSDVIKAQQAELAAAKAEIKALRAALALLTAQMKALTARVDATEQRTGLKPLSTTWLKPMPAGSRLEAGDAIYVGRLGDRGKRRRLSKHVKAYKAHVAVVWATWCKPCTSDHELKLLHKLQPQLARHGVDLVSILVDDLELAQKHAKARRWIYPLWFGKSAHTQWLPEALIRKGLSLPVFLVVGPDLMVRYYAAGKLDDERLRDLVTAAAF